ncbi:hypothetical protein ACJIZ3_003758 [Penstemon smallii]|uniref:Starch synthase, chloroplastic/amyloplastic n=1 Tax=Penstemon smallii TaxID=265156 RepID=A0ABD3S032_9LAMI
MATTVTASHFVSHIHGGGLNSVDTTNSNLAQISLRNQPVTHHGLRKVDMIQMMKKNAILTAKQSSRSGTSSGNVIICGTGMNLVFVAAEVGPWSKTGGLGDVLGGLPPAMAANGHRVMTVSPRYDQYKDAWDTSVLVEYLIALSQDSVKKNTVRFFHCHKRGVDRVFVDHPLFLEKVWGKTKSKVYGPNAGTDYKDNQLRFSLLCQAALEAPRVLNLTNNKYFSGPYGEDVVFIANDWHTALLPCYLKSMYQSKGIYKQAKGRFAFSDFSLLNLPDQFKSSFDFMDGYDKPIKGRKINWMKAGILESDRVFTVSPYYAKELISGDDKGVELSTILRFRTVTGSINGMDIQEWNPATDKYIDCNYDITTVRKLDRSLYLEVMDAKPLLKEALQAAVGLPVDRSIPVIGFIGRLEEQKGSDILVAAISKFIDLNNVQIIILVSTPGTGKKSFEKQIEQLEVLYPDKARGVAKFNVPLAHMITAGADFMLVPSRFEPCGLIQLHAMRYGTIPIVASTGGLVDTVKEGYTGFHMGDFNVECATVDPADVLKIVTTVGRALAVYGSTPLTLAEMIQNCMSQDLSWKGPAKNWEQLLLSLGAGGSEPGIEGEEIAPLAKENVATP